MESGVGLEIGAIVLILIRNEAGFYTVNSISTSEPFLGNRKELLMPTGWRDQ
jgi:hypothetical protein